MRVKHVLNILQAGGSIKGADESSKAGQEGIVL